MSVRTLHITNGSALTNYLLKLEIVTVSNVITWQEALCVGPTVLEVASEEFLNTRNAFFKSVYNIELSKEEIASELQKLDDISNFTEIVLWFEYDLFCHINMVAVISLLEQKGIYLPIYLVCSGRVDGEKGLKALGELNPKQLHSHYDQRVKLNIDDIALAKHVLKIYCWKRS